MAQCIAEPLSRRNIQETANLVREVDGSQDKFYFDIVRFLELKLPKIDRTFTFRVMPQSAMGDCHGLTYPDRNEIQIREDVYERACEDSGRDRLTMAHELFHLLQHDSQNISFARTDSEIVTFRDPEWQANAFGGELLIPRKLVKGMSEQEISDKCKVSYSAARCQMSK